MTYKLIYPKYQQRIFTNRKTELDFLKKRIINPKEPMHLAILGLRKIGKTLLIKEFIKQNSKHKFVYINIEEIITSPEIFSLKIVGKTVYWIFGGEELKLFSYDNLVEYNLSLKSKTLTNFLSDYNNYISKGEKDYSLFLILLFEFFENMAEELREKIIIVFDEFQAVLTLNRYKGLNFLNLFRKYVENARKISYILSGSAVSLMKELTGEKSPLFQLFSEINLSFFNRIDSFILIKKILKNMKTKYQSLIFYFTKGHPFYIYWLCKDLEGKKIDETVIKKVLIQQVLSKEKQIYKHCHYLYKTSLRRARGYNNLKLVIQILSQKEGINANELTKITRKARPAIEDAIEELVKVDLFKLDEEKRIWFIDPVFKLWVSYYELGIEVENFTIKKTLMELIKDLDMKYQTVSSEPGRAKEYEWKVKIEEKFGLKLENYQKGNIEFDLVGRKNDTCYIFEIKHRNRLAGYKEVKGFLDKIQKSEFKDKKKVLVFISKTGFTDKAIKFMKKHKIGHL